MHVLTCGGAPASRARSHEVAATLGLYTETNGEEGERFVTVRKARAARTHESLRVGLAGCTATRTLTLTLTLRLQRAPVGAAAQLSTAELNELARKAAAAKVTRTKLSDAPPPAAVVESVGVVKLNTIKRDLRGVVAVQEEMRAKKEPRVE